MRPHKKLIAWQEAIILVDILYSLTEIFPPKEQFGIISQIRRAAVSVPTNIAEGAARNTRKEFIQFLYISQGSLSELDTLLTISLNLKYIKQLDFDLCIEKMNRISAFANGLIKKLKAENKALT